MLNANLSELTSTEIRFFFYLIKKFMEASVCFLFPLQESSFANRKLLEQLTEEGHEKERLLRELEEAKKVQTHTKKAHKHMTSPLNSNIYVCEQTAEKRKAMLDDMATQLNQEKSDHKEALSDLKLQHEKEVSLYVLMLCL